ncbi:MAG TPA: PepSY-associated TM helix domain-containing protein, partial [Nitrospiraceae bacterium]
MHCQRATAILLFRAALVYHIVGVFDPTGEAVMNDLTPTMNWLHSWNGLLFGWLSFVVFVTGTLTVFDNEITYWMQPEMQEATAAANRSEQPYFSSDLTPIVPVKWQEKRTFSGQTIDPSTGKMITFRDTQGGDFFYHFHYGLLFGASGAVIVSAAAIAMLVALCTGLGIHRRTVKELVTFRPRSVSQRTWLEVHNLAGFLILPFHLMVTLTGLTILWSIFMPADVQFLPAGGPT